MPFKSLLLIFTLLCDACICVMRTLDLFYSLGKQSHVVHTHSRALDRSLARQPFLRLNSILDSQRVCRFGVLAFFLLLLSLCFSSSAFIHSSLSCACSVFCFGRSFFVRERIGAFNLLRMRVFGFAVDLFSLYVLLTLSA